jgi:hypothetical protein
VCGLPQELGPARRVTCGRIESRVRIYRVGCEATRVGWNVLLTLPEWQLLEMFAIEVSQVVEELRLMSVMAETHHSR